MARGAKANDEPFFYRGTIFPGGGIYTVALEVAWGDERAAYQTGLVRRVALS